MFNNFREFLEYLETKGKLVRVKKEVDPRFEIAAGIRKTSDTNGPALLFENVKGCPGWRVTGGLFATRKLLSLALGAEDDEQKLFEKYLGVDQKRIKPKLVGSGPVKEVIIKGNDVDLWKLPIPTYCERDARPYFTAGIEMAKHPQTGIQNVTISRRMLLGKDKTTLSGPPIHHLGLLIAAAQERGERLGVATVMGAHPALTIASQIRPPLGVDETEIAGAIRGKPIELVRCETIDVEVPADAEVVIEGEVLVGEKADDGPFGEYPGNYISMGEYVVAKDSHISRNYVVKTTAITMRKDPIFVAMLTGMPVTENHILIKWATAVAIYRHASTVVYDPEDIKGINLTPGGSCRHHCVISIRKRNEWMARDLIYSLLATRYITGLVIVVDEDVNIYDPVEVEHAIATTVKPDRDIIILPTVPSPKGASVSPVYMYKWGIDATKGLSSDKWLWDKAVPPGVNEIDYI
jgi:UbiD family decarboxylase